MPVANAHALADASDECLPTGNARRVVRALIGKSAAAVRDAARALVRRQHADPERAPRRSPTLLLNECFARFAIAETPRFARKRATLFRLAVRSARVEQRAKGRPSTKSSVPGAALRRIADFGAVAPAGIAVQDACAELALRAEAIRVVEHRAGRRRSLAAPLAVSRSSRRADTTAAPTRFAAGAGIRRACASRSRAAARILGCRLVATL